MSADDMRSDFDLALRVSNIVRNFEEALDSRISSLERIVTKLSALHCRKTTGQDDRPSCVGESEHQNPVHTPSHTCRRCFESLVDYFLNPCETRGDCLADRTSNGQCVHDSSPSVGTHCNGSEDHGGSSSPRHNTDPIEGEPPSRVVIDLGVAGRLTIHKSLLPDLIGWLQIAQSEMGS